MYFLRLIRPVNLAVIVLTMYAVRLFFLPYMHAFGSPFYHIKTEPFDYFLLVFSTVIIAAAGNIINDYFDVKADRINKPERLIITRHIKRRWAIVTHWLFNLVAFAIACYLSWRYATFWYVFIHLFSINALWFYSMYFKRRFLIGNLIIALLTGLVPILCGMHFLGLTIPYNREYLPSSWTVHGEESWITEVNLKIFFVLFFAIFAASLNLIREIIKDMEDVDGDQLLNAKTLPIVLGQRRTKWIALTMMIALLIIPQPFIWEAYAIYGDAFLKVMAPAALVAASILIAFVLLWRAREKAQLKNADLLLKIAMFIGCCLPYYWYLLT